MTQGQASRRWIKILFPVLEQSIVDFHLQPAQTMDDLIRLFRNRQEPNNLSGNEKSESLHLDATEHMMERNTDQDAQKLITAVKKEDTR